MIRRPLFLLLIVLLFLAIIAFLAYRPATVTGVKEHELAHSVRSAVDASGGSCADLPGDVWRCRLQGVGKQGRGVYRVVVHGHFGCWDGHRASGRGPKGPSACITILDYL